MKRTILALAMVLFAACGGANKTPAEDGFVVSIEPLKWLIDNIVGDDFEVTVMVPSGASPETFEPTPKQVMAAENARLVFTTGLIDFERELVGRLPRPERIVDLSEGLQLIGGDLAENSEHEGESDHDEKHDAGHSHSGTDPHTWTSPRALLKMAETAYRKIHEAYPDSASYSASYVRLKERLTELDRQLTERFSNPVAPKSFLIFHPGLTYFARDYGLRQISLEADGKELSVKQLQQTIELAKTENIDKIFYQREFPKSLVEVTAKEIGAEAVEIDILGYDIPTNLLKISNLIAPDER